MSQYLTPTSPEDDELDRRVRETLRSKSLLSWQQLVAAEADAVAVHAALDRIVRKLAVDLDARRTSMSTLRAAVDAGTVTRARFAEAHRKYADWRERAMYFRGHALARLDELAERVKDARARQRADISREEAERFRAALYEVRRQHRPQWNDDAGLCPRCTDCAGERIAHPCDTNRAVVAALEAVKAPSSASAPGGPAQDPLPAPGAGCRPR